MTQPVPRIAVTPGEPAGIGPDLCLALAAQGWPAGLACVADPDRMAARAADLGLSVRVADYVPGSAGLPLRPGTLPVLAVVGSVPVRPGHPDPGNAGYLLECLRRAADGCLDGTFDALVTGPVHKGVINEAGIPFTGHTEFLAEYSRTPQVVMMLATPELRVALVTTHLALAQVSAAITRERVTAVIRVLDGELRRRFGLAPPRILVCGLNPHAGEGGHLGREELEVITPVLDALRGEGLALEGPVPADTAFTPPRLEQADVVLAMYHDQGLPVLKHQGFGRAVNVTLGLPFVRTSVDHGTALDLAGTGRADPGSLQAAIAMARTMAGSRP